MNVRWFKNEDNVSYVQIDEFADNFGKEIGEPNLRKIVEDFKENPSAEGKLVKGTKRTSMKLLIPNIYFNETIPMGETVWAYLGDFYPAYCIYW